jgi:hypothetical protein
MRSENNSLLEKVQLREQEIARLHQTYKGGQTFDGVKDNYRNEQITQEHQQFGQYLRELGQILGIQFNLPNCSFLIEQAQKLKQTHKDLNEDIRELERQLSQAKAGGMADAGKVMSDGEVNRLKSLLREAEDRITQLTKENKRMKAEIDKKE